MSGNYCIDANVFLTAWYQTYPPRILGRLWDIIAEYKDEIILIKPVYDEIEPYSQSHKKLDIEKKREIYPLRAWLEENNFQTSEVNEEVNNQSIKLELEYEISSETKGAGEIDITLISYALINNKTVVTFEARQANRPGKKSNYKIPLICSEQGVDCINFIEFLDRVGISL